MPRKEHLDAFGVTALTAFAALLAFNQVVIRVTNEGMQPVFFAGLRSAGGVVCLGAWMALRGVPVALPRRLVLWGVLIGTVFAVEFVCLFLALDYTTVTRTSVIFYTMPVWLALAAHVLIPGERLSWRKAAGLALAVAGVAWAITRRAPGGAGEASLLGDLFALAAAMAWAGIALCARATPLVAARPETQLFWQVAVSAPILLLAAPLFGPLVRDLAPIHLWGLAFQIVAIVTAGFLFWLWLLTIYPAASVASFSFLSPVFGVAMGWALLDEQVGADIAVALVLVCAGLVLINRPARHRPGPDADRSGSAPRPSG